jgi:hypothetical protein
MDDLPHASNGRGKHQQHSDHGGKNVDEPREAELIGLAQDEPSDAGDEVGGGRESESSEEAEQAVEEGEGHGDEHGRERESESSEEAEQAVEEGEGHGDEHGREDVGGAGDEPDAVPRREVELLDKHRLDHVKDRHRDDLVAADDVDGDHVVGGRDEPLGLRSRG